MDKYSIEEEKSVNNFKHAFKIMRITTLLLFFCILFSQAATGYSQGVELTLGLRSTSIKEICEEIEKKSDFRFIFAGNAKTVINKRVDIAVNSQNIEEILDNILSGTELSYTILDSQVVVYRDEAKIIPKEIEEIVSELISQQQKRQVVGRIIDRNGEAVIGANIVERGTTNGTVTDIDGNFSLQVDENAVLHISYIGYLPQDINTSGQNTFRIILEEDTQALEEVVVVGYGVQRKVTLTGSVANLKGDDMIITRNENAQNMLTGRMPGVRVHQITAEPGAFKNAMDIRGMGDPLVVIDGIPRTMEDFQRLDPNDIDDISVLKDGSAAIYGVRAGNGVVLVTTRRGTPEGLPKLTYSGSYTFQVPSGLPATVDAIDYMTLRNERAMNNVNGGTRIFSEADFEAYRNGTRQSTDWYSLVFAPWSPQTQHNLSATGGNDRTNYFIGMGYLYQEGFFKAGDLAYNKYNLRSNISTKITDRLTFDLNLSGTMDQQERSTQESHWIIRTFWRQGSHIPAYADPEETMFFHGLIEGENPLPMMMKDVTGYRRAGKKLFRSSASLKYQVPGIQGLELRGLFSYDFTMDDNKIFNRAYDQFRYDEASGTYQQWTRQSPSTIRRENFSKNQVLTQAQLDYNRIFGSHRVSALLVWETQKRNGDNFYAFRELAFPLEHLFAGVGENQLGYMSTSSSNLYEYAYESLAGRLNYSFADKYIVDFLFRNDGSSRFTSRKQWGFFPSIQAAWRVSEEGFFRSSPLSFMNEFKIRGSYGQTGHDGALAYQFLTGYTYPSSNDRRNFNGGYVFNGNFIASATNTGIPNTAITWTENNTYEVGVDIEAWHGLLGVTYNLFTRRRDGLLATRSSTLPTVVGASMPQENINSDKHFGMELELSHRNRINDLRYNLRGHVSLTRYKRLYVERSPSNSSWNNWWDNQNDRLQGIHRGRNVVGRYESWEDIWNSPVYYGRTTVPGNFIYEDWNGDGEINDLDRYPIRYSGTPYLNFGLSTSASWRSFDLSMNFQGSAMTSIIYGEQLREPLWGNDNSSAMVQFMNRWRPADPAADPWNPATQWIRGHFAYTGNLPDANSSFNVEDGAYLRLKTLELGYSIPYRDLQNLRVFFNAYNLLTITKVKHVDPEHTDESWGYLYPLNKTYSIGLNVTF